MFEPAAFRSLYSTFTRWSTLRFFTEAHARSLMFRLVSSTYIFIMSKSYTTLCSIIARGWDLGSFCSFRESASSLKYHPRLWNLNNSSTVQQKLSQLACLKHAKNNCLIWCQSEAYAAFVFFLCWPQENNISEMCVGYAHEKKNLLFFDCQFFQNCWKINHFNSHWRSKKRYISNL